MTRARFGHLLNTKKLLVMAVVDENRIGQISPEMEEFRSMLVQVMERNLDRYRQHFQFGWTGSPELANSVAMETLSLPHLLVVNTSRYILCRVSLQDTLLTIEQKPEELHLYSNRFKKHEYLLAVSNTFCLMTIQTS